MSIKNKQNNKNNIDVSIIIVNWNTKDFLQECLHSVFETTHEVTFEVIVVDNGSCDGSLEMVTENYPYVKLIQTGSNLGFAKANNVGIKNSKGRHICLVNSDVVIREGCIDKMYMYIQQHPPIGILGPRILNPDLTLQSSCRGNLSLWNTFCRSLALDTIFPRSTLFGGLLMNYWPHDTIRRVDAILGCFWMVRREALNQVGLLDEQFFMYAEDIDWCKRFWKTGWEVVFFPYAEAIHYGGGSSLEVPIKSYVKANRSSFVYWRKYHGKVMLTCFYSVILIGEIIRIVRASILFLIKSSERTEARFKIMRSFWCILWLLNIHNPKEKDSQKPFFSEMNKHQL